MGPKPKPKPGAGKPKPGKPGGIVLEIGKKS